MPEQFSAEERSALERGLATKRSGCPRCGGTLEQHPVPPRADVSYVRDRIWVLCGGCGCNAVLDRERIARMRGPP